MTEDRVLYWPTVLTVAWPLAFILIWSAPFGLTFFGAPLVLVFWAISASPALALAIGFALGRSWLRCLAMLPLPIITLVAALNLDFVWRAGQEGGQYVHFYFMRPIYLNEISRLPTNEQRLVLFDWGGFLTASSGVVYDESDEIALPERERSEAWKKRAHGTGVQCVFGDTPMGDHFYVVGFDC